MHALCLRGLRLLCWCLILIEPEGQWPWSPSLLSLSWLHHLSFSLCFPTCYCLSPLHLFLAHAGMLPFLPPPPSTPGAGSSTVGVFVYVCGIGERDMRESTHVPLGSQCSRSCGGGFSVRDVQCVDMRDLRPLRPFHCQPGPTKPAARQPCATQPCLSWYTSSWREVRPRGLLGCGKGQPQTLPEP